MGAEMDMYSSHNQNNSDNYHNDSNLTHKKRTKPETPNSGKPSSTENIPSKDKIIEDEGEDTSYLAKLLLPSEIGTDFTFKRDIVWFNAIGFLILHIFATYGLYLQIIGRVRLYTSLFGLFWAFVSGLGVTMGAHRLFSHRTYKAVTSLRIILLILHTVAGQNCLWVWARDHRQHHKYSDTDADPHNASRGFFFSHIGWLMSKKHPKVIEYGKKIDMSDLEADYWVMFQKRYYKTLYFFFALLLPVAIPVYFWNETWWNSLMVVFFTRNIVQLNLTWCVNSVAHIFGNKPYDQNILPVESKFVSMFGIGEGWHNYHHSFPWDYRAAELGTPYNFTTKVIDFCAKYGYVYDRKTVNNVMLKNRILRTGDGTHHTYGPKTAEQTEEENTLRKYIVDKKDVGSKLLMEQLEKDIKYDDFNNNAKKEALKISMSKDFNQNGNILQSTKASLNVAS